MELRGRFVCCFFFLLEAFLLMQTTGGSLAGSRLEFVSSPDAVSLGLTKELKLRCSLSGNVTQSASSSNNEKPCSCKDVGHRELPPLQDVDQTRSARAAQVTSVLITKIGFTSQSIASIVAGHPPVAYVDLGQLRVQGDIGSSPGKKAYLELAWFRPDLHLDGDYQCQINALDENGRPISFIHNLRVKITEPTISQLVQQLWEVEELSLKTQSELDLAKQQISTIESAMASLSPAHTEEGEVTCGGSSSWSVGTIFIPVTPTRLLSFKSALRSLQHVVFQHPYDSEPAVIISFNSVNLEHAKFSSAILNMTRFGFTIECSFWTTSVNTAGHMNVKWLSTVKGMNQTRYVNPWEAPQIPLEVHN